MFLVVMMRTYKNVQICLFYPTLVVGELAVVDIVTLVDSAYNVVVVTLFDLKAFVLDFESVNLVQIYYLYLLVFFCDSQTPKIYLMIFSVHLDHHCATLFYVVVVRQVMSNDVPNHTMNFRIQIQNYEQYNA